MQRIELNVCIGCAVKSRISRVRNHFAIQQQIMFAFIIIILDVLIAVHWLMPCNVHPTVTISCFIDGGLHHDGVVILSLSLRLSPLVLLVSRSLLLVVSMHVCNILENFPKYVAECHHTVLALYTSPWG